MKATLGGGIGGVGRRVAAAIALALSLAPGDLVAQRTTYTTQETKLLSVLSDKLLGPGVIIAPSAPEAGSTYGNQAQIGLFSGLLSEVVPFTNGVLISTGNIASGASITNESLSAYGTSFNDSIGDVDINNLFGSVAGGTWDAVNVVLHVVPSNSTINIPFMFASEEYFWGAGTFDEPDVSSYAYVSDRFACFIEPGIVPSSTTQVNFTNNIARLPSGHNVEIASVNQHTNVQYFVANVETNGPGEMVVPTGNIPIPMAYNGAAVGPTASIRGLVPGQVYTVKISLADQSDRWYDSAVFLKERGITSGADLAIDVAADDPVVGLGAASGYTVTVSNVGPVAADDVVVTNRFPAGVVHVHPGDVVASRGTVNPLGSGEYEWILGALTNGTSATLALAGVFDNAGVYTNAASVATSTGDYDPSNDADAAAIVVSAGNPLVITVDPASRMYGAPDPDFSFADFSGQLLPGDTIADITGGAGTAADVIFALASTTIASPVGVYSNEIVIVHSSLDGPKASLYDITVVAGTLTITNAPLEITAASDTKAYDGTPLVNAGYSITGGSLASGDALSSVTVAGSQTAVGSSPNVASDAVILRGAENATANYAISYVAGALTVTNAPLEITAASDTKVYDGTPLVNAGYSITGGSLAVGDALDSVTVVGSQTAVGSSPNVASAATILTGTVDATANYAITYVDGTLTVTARALEITAASDSKVYDGTPLVNTNYTITAGSLASGDTLDSVTVAGSQTAVGSSPNVASAATILTGTVDATANYAITYVPGSLTVTARALEITAASDSKVYDGTPLVNTNYTITGGSLASGDTLDSVTVVGSQTAVGSSANVASAATILTGAVDATANYAITYVDGTLAVTARALEITAASDTKVYDGTPLVNTNYTITAGSLATGDTLSSVTVVGSQTAVGSSANVASEATILTGTVDATANYAITYVDGTLTVTARALEITAASDSKVYDGTPLVNTNYTITAGSLASGDALSSVTVVGSQTAVGSSANVASAATILTGTVDATANYAITYVDGTLTVTARALEITAASDTKAYDGTALVNAGYAITAGALASGDTLDSVTVVGSQTAVGSSANVASAATILRGAENVTTNYAISYMAGALTVTNAPLEITAASDSKVYDGTPLANTNYTITAGSLASGDTLSSVTVAGSQTAVGSSPNVASAATILTGTADATANYAITYVDGTLTVTARSLEITAASDSKVYDGTPLVNAGYTITAGSLASGDTLDSVTVAGSQTAVGSSPNVASAATILTGTADATANYAITYVDGTLTVTARSLEITAASDSKVYDGTPLVNAGYTITAGSLASGDTLDSVTVAGSQTAVGSSANVASEATILTGTVDATANYAITYVDGTLTVTARSLTIVVNNASRGLSATQNPAFSFQNFASQLAVGDTPAGITGGAGTPADVVFTLASTIFGSPAGVYTNEIGIATNSLDGARAANYAITIDNGDLTILATQPDINVTAVWTLNFSTGLFDGVLTAVNSGDGEVPADYDYWFAIANTVEYRLWTASGGMPDGKAYQNLTATVRAALAGVGNRDAVWNPGERIVIAGLKIYQIYHLRRVNPRKYVDPNTAFGYGRLFSGQDRDRNFAIDESELNLSADGWRSGALSDRDMVEASRLGAGDAYLWDKELRAWRVIAR